MQFTGLPIINIQADEEFSTLDTLVYSEIIDPYYDERNSEQYIQTNANMHIRGHSSRAYAKNAFKYEMIKEDGDNRKKNLFGMRKDDDWVLDALYCDPSNIRNVLCCDLWNEINSMETTNDYDIDLESEFVEVFINDKYAGIYVLKEPVDAKQVGIEKEISKDILVKGYSYNANYKTEESFENINVQDGTAYDIFKLIYPKDSTDEIIESNFRNFLEKINQKFDLSIGITYEYLKKNFNLNNIIDYDILVNFVKGWDNFSTNNVFFYLDETGKIVNIPWDMDMSFGLAWGNEELNPTTNAAYIYEYQNVEQVCTMYYNQDDLGEYNNKVKERYNYLRQNILSYDNVEKICNNYKTLLLESGAYERDRNLYYNYDLEKEIEDILSWCEKRIDYLDKVTISI